MRPTRFGTFGYPFAGDGRERPFVACWILAMAAFLVPPLAVVPLVPLLGYLTSVIAASARGEAAPGFGADLRALLGRGLATLFVVLGYLLGPALVLLVTVYGAITRVQGSQLASGERLLLYAGSTAVLVLFLVAAFLVPAALAVAAETGRLRAAFSLDRVRPLAGHAAYFSRWMAGAVALVTIVSIASVSLQIRRAGPIVASLLVVYGAVLTCHVWGHGVRLARQR
jgi:hypothetical protein